MSRVNIFHNTSRGVHQFLKLGATPVTCSEDILEVLKIKQQSPLPVTPIVSLSPAEQQVIKHLSEPTHRDELIRRLDLPTNEAAQLLMMMELAGQIKSEQNIYRHTLT